MVIVIGMGVYSWLDGEAYRSAAELAVESRESMQQIEKMLSLLADAENGQRGYLLTGDSSYLSAYTALIPRIQEVEARVRRSGKADPDAARLSDMVGIKLKAMQRTIDLRACGGEEEALGLMRSGPGVQAMMQIRALAGKAEERRMHILANSRLPPLTMVTRRVC